MSAGHSSNVRLSVYKRDDWTCRACGFRQTSDERLAAVEALAARTGSFDQWLTIDHIVPRAKGGNNRIENLQTLCNLCNTKKADLCDPADVIAVRLRKTLKKLRGKRDVPRLVHDRRCDLDYCFHLCPVYLERGVYV